MKQLAALWLGLMLVPAAIASPPTDDGGGGMTCQYFLAAAGMAWQRPGGDWTDADGAVHGVKPFASADVARLKGAQPVEWDATPLLKTWAAAGAWPGAVLLRRQAGGRSGTVELASREHGDAALHPRLKVTWSDGQSSELPAMADAHFSCPNFRSAGASPLLKLGPEQGAMLLFAMPSRPGVQPQRARLLLSSVRQTGGGGTIGLYAGRRPGGAGGAVEHGLAAAYLRDIGLERNADVWLVDRFDTAARPQAWLGKADSERVQLVRPGSVGQRFEALDGTAAEVTLHAGSTQALNSHIKLAGRPQGEPQEAYFRYYLRLGDNWNPTIDGGKLPGLAGTYNRAGWGGRKADGSNGWSARGSFLQQTAAGSAIDELRAIGSYVYHAGMETRYGDNWGWNLGPSGVLQKNRWYCIEQHVKLNTPGQPDGVLRTWVDGRLAFDRQDIRFRDSDALRIESVWMNVYHGGARPAPHDLTLYIDNIVVAGRYIGPMGQGARP